MNRRTKIYVAGAISKGSLTENIYLACEAGLKLIQAGYAPLVPHLTCYLNGPPPETNPRDIPHETWLESARPWVLSSDALLRLPGESAGADMEERWALDANIRVFNNVKMLCESMPTEQEDKGDPRYLALLADMAALHKKKSADYGKGDDPLANLRGCESAGVPAHVGAWIRAKDKVHRVDAFFRNGRLENEGVIDSLMDLSAYALLTVLLLQEKATAT